MKKMWTSLDLEILRNSHGCQYVVQCMGFIVTKSDFRICTKLTFTFIENIVKNFKHPMSESIIGKIVFAVRHVIIVNEKKTLFI